MQSDEAEPQTAATLEAQRLMCTVQQRIREMRLARVFLSYARDDAETARPLAELIGRAGHLVWWDRHIQGGSRFASEIDRELQQADAVVVLWTEASVQSAWVQDEAAEGRDNGRLVPVTLGGCKPPLGFRQFQSIDLADWAGTGEPGQLDDLLHAIDKAGGETSLNSTASGAAAAKQKKRSVCVCVLPFLNMSGESEQEYFSDGITEDIITDLSKVSALSVIARNTAFTFKGRTLDVKEVASALQVSHVVEGSVRKAGSRVRITAQLIDGKAGDHVWAERYDRDLTDIFAIQDEISKAIVDALRLKLLPQEKKAIEQRGTSSVEAYNFYLMARQYWIGGTYGDIRRDEAIVRICSQAVALDPDYAEAWALMALAQAELRFWHAKPENALPAAERALSINPNIPEAHCVKARYLEEEGKQEEANSQVDEALKLNPDSWEVNREAARLMFRQGRIEEASRYFEKAVGLMDQDYHNAAMLMTCYRSLGDDAALQRATRTVIERVKRAISKDPTNSSALPYGALAFAMVGESDRAREWIQRALVIDPDNLTMRYNLGCALALELKDVDAAIEVLQPFFEKVSSPTHLKHMEADPDLDVIREDPRFKRMFAEARERIASGAGADA